VLLSLRNLFCNGASSGGRIVGLADGIGGRIRSHSRNPLDLEAELAIATQS
jgi:hypothetical protein